ncbi:MAG: bifunctional riboflavin kinase/FAD synthetase [Erysipelotrichaceae bacterium]
MKILHVEVGDCELNLPEISACIGYFDGIHIGHQQLIKKVIHLAKQDKTIPSLITFDPDPWSVVKGEQHLAHLTTMAQRIKTGEELGLKLWIILRFNQEMANLSVDAFHQLLINQLHVKTLVCGYDFTYGKFGKGNIETLAKQSYFSYQVLDAVKYQGQKISSTRIETALLQGNVKDVKALLGHYYQLEGIVIRGNQIGRTISFPTANLKLIANYILPKKGVYAGYAQVQGKQYSAFINIGYNPTFNLKEEVSIEVHIFDFNLDIYNESVTIVFVERLRDEMKFDSKDALVKQLIMDKERTLTIIANDCEEDNNAIKSI